MNGVGRDVVAGGAGDDHTIYVGKEWAADGDDGPAGMGANGGEISAAGIVPCKAKELRSGPSPSRDQSASLHETRRHTPLTLVQ